MAARKKAVRKKAPKKATTKKKAPARKTSARKAPAKKKAAKKTAKKAAKKPSRKKVERTVRAQDVLPRFSMPPVPAPTRPLPPPPALGRVKAKAPQAILSSPKRAETPSIQVLGPAPARTQKRVISQGVPKVRLPSPRGLFKGGLGGGLGWIAAGTLGLVWLITRRAEAAPPPLPLPAPSQPSPTGPLPPLTIEPEPAPATPTIPSQGLLPPGAAPPGFIRLKTMSRAEGVPRAHVGFLANIATEYLKRWGCKTCTEPFGTFETFVHDGKRYAAALEEHFHEPGGPVKPWGPHKGISLFMLKTDREL